MNNARASLWSQSGQFWLGAFMIAEVPAGIAITIMPDATHADLLDRVLQNGWAMILALAVVIACGLLVGWIAHRVGLGE